MQAASMTALLLMFSSLRTPPSACADSLLGTPKAYADRSGASAETNSAATASKQGAQTKQPYVLSVTKEHLLPGKQTQARQAQGQESELGRLMMAAAQAAAPLSRSGDAHLHSLAESQARLLSSYDIELVVDCSASMQKHDCPGALSRWDWCGVQAKELGTQLAPFTKGGLTLTTFASSYDVHRNATPGNITHLFGHPSFRIGTRLAGPLSDRLLRFFERQDRSAKPLLIAVITDGVPHPSDEPRMVAKALVAASKQMVTPHEVTIVFFQIGDSNHEGRAFLNYLDRGLVGDGADFDLVRTVSFEHLRRVGLARALVDSIRDFHAQNFDVPHYRLPM
jgi:hypothetical protein